MKPERCGLCVHFGAGHAVCLKMTDSGRSLKSATVDPARRSELCPLSDDPRRPLPEETCSACGRTFRRVLREGGLCPLCLSARRRPREAPCASPS